MLIQKGKMAQLVGGVVLALAHKMALLLPTSENIHNTCGWECKCSKCNM